MKTTLCAGAFAALLTCASLGGPPTPTPSEALHKALQAQFDDLTLVEKKGMLGVSRVEITKLRSHGLRNLNAKSAGGWSLTIFGAHGKPLDKNPVGVRYAKWSGAIGPDLMTESSLSGKKKSAQTLATERLVKKAAKEFGEGKSKLLVAKSGPYLMEARPIRLSKKECLGCHQGMKLGDAVAFSLIKTRPGAPAKKPLR